MKCSTEKLWHLHRQSCLIINQKYCHLLTESHFIMSRINPSSSLSVILNMRWSSSRITLSRGTLKNGSAWHPGCFDHKLSSFLAMASLWKYSQECDILHLQHREMEDVRYRLMLFLPSKNTAVCYLVYYALLFESTVLDLSFLWSLHQMQLLFAVAPSMPMAISKNWNINEINWLIIRGIEIFIKKITSQVALVVIMGLVLLIG